MPSRGLSVVAKSCAVCSAAATICPRPCKWWLAGLPFWLIFGHDVKLSADLDLWPLDLGTGMQSQPWHGQPFCQFWCFCDFFFPSYGQTRVKLRTWRYNLDLWPSRSPSMSVMRVIVFDPCTKFVDRRTSRSGIFGRGVKRASDLDLWPFDLLMGLRIPRVMGFLPANLPLAMPFCSGLSAGTGQTDRRTDRRRSSMHYAPLIWEWVANSSPM